MGRTAQSCDGKVLELHERWRSTAPGKAPNATELSVPFQIVNFMLCGFHPNERKRNIGSRFAARIKAEGTQWRLSVTAPRSLPRKRCGSSRLGRGPTTSNVPLGAGGPSHPAASLHGPPTRGLTAGSTWVQRPRGTSHSLSLSNCVPAQEGVQHGVHGFSDVLDEQGVPFGNGPLDDVQVAVGTAWVTLTDRGPSDGAVLCPLTQPSE